MIDLHCHFLPGVDDGPETLVQSLALARIAVADGITCSVVTPHIHPGRWENNKVTIQAAVEQLREALEQQKIPLRLGFAAEIRITDMLFPQLETDQLPFYGEYQGFKTLLLEFPHSHIIPGSDKLIRWLMNHKIRPLIAHPERNKEIMRTPNLLGPLLDEGCYLQVTAGSIVGRFGEKAQYIAEQLILEDKVTVIATDAHNRKLRPPIMSEARQKIVQLVGEETAKKLTHDMPLELAGAQFS